MPGYVILESKSLAPPKPAGQGIKANIKEIGFLDFIREIQQDDFPFNENSSLRVTGLEDYLIQMRPDMNKEALKLRKIMQAAGNNFYNSGCGDIQIVFRGDLVMGQHLIVRHPTADIPIYLLFGFTEAQMINNQKIYKATFNLN